MKKISYILCMLLTSVMFAACTSDDLVENDGVKMGHDEKGNYIYVTVSAGTPNTPQSRADNNPIFMNFDWKDYSKIIVLVDGHRSELTIVPGSISKDMKSARFEGRLYYGNVVPTETTILRAYIETYFTKINNDGSYEMTKPTEMNYGSATQFDGGITRRLEDHGVFYAETTYSSSNLTFNFSPKTAALVFHVNFINYQRRNLGSYNPVKIVSKLSAKGLFGPSQTLITGTWSRNGGESGSNIECACIVDTRYPVSDMKLSLTYSDGQNVERRIELAKSTNRLEPGKIYQKEINFAPQVGDYLYSSGGWGDLLPNEMIDKKDVVGIVFASGTPDVAEGLPTNMFGLAVSLKNLYNYESFFTEYGQSISDIDIYSNTLSADQINDNSYPLNDWGIIRNEELDNDFTFSGEHYSYTLNSYDAVSSAHNYLTYNYNEWYLPSAAEMKVLAKNMYGATSTVKSDTEITLSSFNRSKLKTQIDRLAGVATFNDLDGTYWTTNFLPFSTSYNTIGWVAQFDQEKTGNKLRTMNITDRKERAYIRPVTRVGYFPVD